MHKDLSIFSVLDQLSSTEAAGVGIGTGIIALVFGLAVGLLLGACCIIYKQKVKKITLVTFITALINVKSSF